MAHRPLAASASPSDAASYDAFGAPRDLNRAWASLKENVGVPASSTSSGVDKGPAGFAKKWWRTEGRGISGATGKPEDWEVRHWVPSAAVGGPWGPPH